MGTGTDGNPLSETLADAQDYFTYVYGSCLRRPSGFRRIA